MTINKALMNTANQLYFAKWMMGMLKVGLIHRNFAEKRPMPANSGVSITWKYMNEMAAQTTALTEGVAPAAITPTITEVTATPDEYGGFVNVTDMIEVFDTLGQILINPSSARNVELLSQNANRTLDNLMRDVISAGTNVYYSGATTVTSRTGVGSANIVSIADLRKIVRALRLNNVKPISGIIQGAVGQGTIPLPASYIGFVDPYTVHDLELIPGWKSVHEYASPLSAYPDEAGYIQGVNIRFISTTDNKVFTAGGSGGIDVYSTLIFGKEFYGETDILGKNTIEFLAKPPGSAGTTDPLNQIASIGWKTPAYAGVILRQVAGYRYEHAVSS